MVGIENESNVAGAKYGFAYGHKYLFTHRNPKTGEWWAESCGADRDFKGEWIPGDAIRFV